MDDRRRHRDERRDLFSVGVVHEDGARAGMEERRGSVGVLHSGAGLGAACGTRRQVGGEVKISGARDGARDHGGSG